MRQSSTAVTTITAQKTAVFIHTDIVYYGPQALASPAANRHSEAITSYHSKFYLQFATATGKPPAFVRPVLSSNPKEARLSVSIRSGQRFRDGRPGRSLSIRELVLLLARVHSNRWVLAPAETNVPAYHTVISIRVKISPLP